MTESKRIWTFLCTVMLVAAMAALAGCSTKSDASTYEIAVQNGFTGTVSEWVVSLAGRDGKSAYELAGEQGYRGTAAQWLAALAGEAAELGDTGENGVSAYELAAKYGFSGSEKDWLQTLVGQPGAQYAPGKSIYQIACRLGYEETLAQWLDALLDQSGNAGDGMKLPDAYHEAAENGFQGSFAQWLVSLTVADGCGSKDGSSAYQLACEQNGAGTLQEWLSALVSGTGTDTQVESVPDQNDDETDPTQAGQETKPKDETSESTPDDSTQKPTDGSEVTVVSAYVNDQMHLILVMSDGTEVDSGSVIQEETFKVIFQDRSGLVIATETVVKGGDAVPPEVPVEEGYVFAGWSGSYKNVTEDRMIQATYIPQTTEPEMYTVTFVDFDGRVLSEQKVQKGAAAVEPAAPVREGYKFTGWDREFVDVKNDLTVKAQYTEESGEVFFTAEDVTARAGDTVKIVVAVQNNPAILGMCMHITFDEDVLTLIECENGSAFAELSMTPPKDKRSDCICVWYGADVSEVLDGDVLTITFAVNESTKAGSTEVTVSAVDIYDREYTEHMTPETHCKITVE